MGAQHIDVRHVAQLARMRLTPEEEIEFGGQLDQVLGFMSQLQQLDVRGVEPTAHRDAVGKCHPARRGPSFTSAGGSAPQCARPGGRTVYCPKNRRITLPAMIHEIAFTFYPVTDMPRARAFYEGSLGLQIESNYDEVWIEYNIGGATLAISTMLQGHQPGARGAGVALEVKDFDAAIAALRAKGVKFLLEPMDTPVCRMAAIADPDDNGLVIHQRRAA
jgi:predicted enzyme related to lactoylglutathione lyase